MIPRILHRIWFCPPMPAEFRDYGEQWREVMPDWAHVLWTANSLPADMVNKSVFDAAPESDPHRWRSDVLRLEVLLQFGGVYVDADTQPLRPLDALLPGVGCFAAWSPNRRKDGGEVLTNATLGAVPWHPFIQELANELPLSAERYAGQRTAMVTGPYHLDRVWRSKLWPDVRIFPAAVFYPQTAADNYAGTVPDLSHSYTWHRWHNRDPRRKQ
jgi:mannosyltransferase OCH1-like enzyme